MTPYDKYKCAANAAHVAYIETRAHYDSAANAANAIVHYHEHTPYTPADMVPYINAMIAAIDTHYSAAALLADPTLQNTRLYNCSATHQIVYMRNMCDYLTREALASMCIYLYAITQFTVWRDRADACLHHSIEYGALINMYLHTKALYEAHTTPATPATPADDVKV